MQSLLSGGPWSYNVMKKSRDFLHSRRVRVAYALSHCIQVCLAVESILAVMLSLSHGFSAAEFQKTIAAIWKETPAQRSTGAVDGEVNEHYMFSTLQLACHGTSFPCTVSVQVMIQRHHHDLLFTAKEIPVAAGFPIFLKGKGWGSFPTIGGKRPKIRAPLLMTLKL